jgi:hypothetical protein
LRRLKSENLEDFWYDNAKKSEPEKGKYVRSAKNTPLGYILRRIDQQLLGANDQLLPPFIYGGLKGKSHLDAAGSLIGTKRQRTLLKIDMKTFFEQIKRERVFYFWHSKCKCSKEVANFLADLCCVPAGAQGSGSANKVLTRGFATSVRLATWCSLNFLVAAHNEAQGRLRKHDPRDSVFVDDIGVTASRVTESQMDSLYDAIDTLATTVDPNNPLILNHKKKRVIPYTKRPQHLGAELRKTKLAPGTKLIATKNRTKDQLDEAPDKSTRIVLMRKKKGVRSNLNQIHRVNLKLKSGNSMSLVAK